MKGRHFNRSYPSVPRYFQSAVLGHELGNVLNGLLGMAELLGETRLNAEQSQWLDAIVHSGRQMHALIQSEWLALHHHTRVPRPSRQPVDGVRLLERVITSHVPAARRNNNRLYLSISPKLPRFWECDPRMTQQLLDNVLGNAVKFTRNGDIQVDVLTQPAKGMLLLRISDSGPGLATQKREDSCVAEPGEWVTGIAGPASNGLGLPVCRQIISALNGEFRIAQREHTGTQIEITLPDVFDESSVPHMECSLFRLIQCRLNFAGPLLPVARNILDRLRVAWTIEDPNPYEDCLLIELSEQSAGDGRGDRRLLIQPVSAGEPDLQSRTLALPLLESTLGALLLEMALSWRTQALRNDIPD